jgi:serine/threonine protein phosphatase PrpC
MAKNILADRLRRLVADGHGGWSVRGRLRRLLTVAVRGAGH